MVFFRSNGLTYTTQDGLWVLYKDPTQSSWLLVNTKALTVFPFATAEDAQLYARNL